MTYSCFVYTRLSQKYTSGITKPTYYNGVKCLETLNIYLSFTLIYICCQILRALKYNLILVKIAESIFLTGRKQYSFFNLVQYLEFYLN